MSALRKLRFTGGLFIIAILSIPLVAAISLTTYELLWLCNVRP